MTTPDPTTEHPESRRLWATLILSMLLASLGTSIANVALPTIALAFAVSFDAVRWIVIAYLASLTVSVVVVGRLGDRYGLRRLHLIGLGLFAAASLACGLAPGLPLLIVSRAVQGAGAAILMTLTIALVRGAARPDRMGRAMGLLGTVSALGTALGPSLGGVLVAFVGWRAIFLVQVPLTLVALGLALRALPRDEAGRGPARADGLFAGFDAALVPSLASNLLVAAVMMATLVVGPFYLGRGLGLDDLAIGLVMSVGPTISIVSGIPSGRLVDRWGAPRVLRLGVAMLAAGALALALLPALVGLAGYVLAVTVLTPGYQLFQAANNTAVMAEVASERRGVVSGLLGLSRNLGLMLGASVLGALFAFGVGSDVRDAAPDAITQGWRLTFLVAAALMLIAFGLGAGRVIRRPSP
ncbi:MFS transporter [Methyloraptor flagellatus]|uniref:MFS transporter n=1 Tax=Methyloraptor flagellatus TaxID=3162530 RepID=A0AAU7XA67_9HYPH